MMEPVEIVNQYKQLELVLGSKYIDIVDRLKLNTIPYCLRNKEFCYLNHSKKCKRTATRIDRYESSKIKFSLIHNRPIHMLKMIEDICLRDEFPGEEAIFSIFELILTICDTKDTKYTKKFVLNQCHIIMENLLFKFPPCWHDLRDSYKNILLVPQNIKKFLLNEDDNQKPTNRTKIIPIVKQTIFDFVLTMLEEIIAKNNYDDDNINNENLDDDDDDDSDIDDDNTESNTTMNNTNSEILNFEEWEAKQLTNKSFNTFSKNDKLKRLFIILHIIVHILEYDLSVWMLRYASKNTEKYMLEDCNLKPIVSFFFNFGIYNLITDIVKRTLKLYVMMIGYKYSDNYIRIFNRLISVLSVAINLCERSNSSQIIYPNIGQKTIEFSKILYKIVDEKFGCHVHVHLRVIENLCIPFMKFLYIDHLLCKMDIDLDKMSVEKITKNFHKNRWLKCAKYIEDKENTNKFEKNDDTIKRSSSSTTSASSLLSKIDENTRKTSKTDIKSTDKIKKSLVHKQNLNKKMKKNEIYRHEYLNLLLDALKSCCDTYALKNVLKIFSNDEEFLTRLLNNNNNNKSMNNSNKRKGRKKRGRKFKYNLDKVEKDIEIYEKQFNIQALKKLSVNNENDFICFDGIYVDEKIFSIFRNEIKFLLILKKNIPILKQKYGDEFNDLNNFLNEIFDEKQK